MDVLQEATIVPTPRRAEDEKQIDLEPEPLTLTTQKQRNLPARGDSLLPTHGELRDADSESSEQASLARAMENGQLYITNKSFIA